MKNNGLLNSDNHQAKTELSKEDIEFFAERINALRNEKLSKKDLILRCALSELIIMQGKLSESEKELKGLRIEQRHYSFLNQLPEKLKLIVERVKKEQAKERSRLARQAKTTKDKQRLEKLLQVWAAGNFKNHEICAEQEYEACGYKSKKAAENALIRAPKPNPWPAKSRLHVSRIFR